MNFLFTPFFQISRFGFYKNLPSLSSQQTAAHSSL